MDIGEEDEVIVGLKASSMKHAGEFRETFYFVEKIKRDPVSEKPEYNSVSRSLSARLTD